MIHALLLSTALATPTSDLVATAQGAGSFEVLLKAVAAADLVDALRSADELTVLAPSDEAFARVPEDVLQRLLLPENREVLASVLKFHVISGRKSAAELLLDERVETLEGSTIGFSLKDGAVRANDVRVVANDIAASNGVIHVIDQVLLPDDFSLPPSVRTPADLMELGIRRGVPLYNAGQQAACAAVYEVTVRSVLALAADDIGAEKAALLRDALDRAAKQSAVERAWTLRQAMDDFLMNSTTQGTPRSTPTPSWATVFDFERDAPESRWFSVNDDVMGGISRGGYEQVTDSVGAFRGALSLENNGGFSTVRSPASDLGLGAFDGFVLRVRGDGRTYSLSALNSDKRFEVRTWRAPFATVAGEWQELRVPFSDLQLSVMGRRLPGALDPADIRSLSFSLSDKDETPFRLEIDWIRAYRADPGTG